MKNIKKKYKTTRKIRGQKRKVEITRKKNGKESIKILSPKKLGRKKKTHRPLPVKEAKKIHAKRSKRSRILDEKKANKKQIKDARWKKSPERFDFPGVDTLKKKSKQPEKKSRIEKLKKKYNNLRKTVKIGKRMESIMYDVDYTPNGKFESEILTEKLQDNIENLESYRELKKSRN